MTNVVQPDGHWPHVRHNRDGRPATIRRRWSRETASTLIDALSAAGIWIAIGLVIYFLYGRFRSRLRTM